MNKLILIYITNPSDEVALEVANHLLKKRLIACANILPSKSVYYWEGALKQETESILLGKTIENLFDQICQEVALVHPYQTPCIVKVEAAASEKFAQWVIDATT